MKTIIVAPLLGAVASRQQPTAPHTPAPGQPAASKAQPQQPGQAQPQQKKEIKDPADYNAYLGAVQQQDVNAKISGLEAFLTQYPNSVMKQDALELLMGS